MPSIHIWNTSSRPVERAARKERQSHSAFGQYSALSCRWDNRIYMLDREHAWLTSSCPRRTKGDGRKMFTTVLQAFYLFSFNLSGFDIQTTARSFFIINGVSRVKSFNSMKARRNDAESFEKWLNSFYVYGALVKTSHQNGCQSFFDVPVPFQ